MRSLLIAIAGVLFFVGCADTGPPAIPTDPLPAGVSLPAGMPNDRWFNETVLKSEVPVLVDFTAGWCPPCQAMKPAIAGIEKAYGNRLKVVELDIDEHAYLSDFFRIKGIPRLMVIQGGKIQADEVGQQSYSQLVSLVKSTAGAP